MVKDSRGAADPGNNHLWAMAWVGGGGSGDAAKPVNPLPSLPPGGRRGRRHASTYKRELGKILSSPGGKRRLDLRLMGYPRLKQLGRAGVAVPWSVIHLP